MDLTVQMHQPIPSVLGDSKCKMDADVQKSKVASSGRSKRTKLTNLFARDTARTPNRTLAH